MIRWGKHSYAATQPIVHSFGSVGEPEPDIEVGAYCSLAAGIEFLPGGLHDMEAVSTFPWHRLGKHTGFRHRLRGPIRIGSDVWIGTGVKVLGGVTIGDGAVIGAYAVVAKDVPPYYLAVGNPVQARPRWPHSQHAEALQRIAWWEWPDNDPRFADLLALSVADFVARHDPRG